MRPPSWIYFKSKSLPQMFHKTYSGNFLGFATVKECNISLTYYFPYLILAYFLIDIKFEILVLTKIIVIEENNYQLCSRGKWLCKSKYALK